jgi:outer membrane protein TolC
MKLRLCACLALALAGCATYKSLPLPTKADLATSVAGLKTQWPARAGEPTRSINIQGPLDLDELALLAILNDPDLKSQRGELDSAQADLLQASLLPNPSVGVGWAGPVGSSRDQAVSSWSVSIAQDVTSLITYHRRHEAARATFEQVRTNLLWDQWQVAQKARLLAVDIYWNDQSLQLSSQERDVVGKEIGQVQNALTAGNLDNTVLAPLLAAKATLDQAYHSLELDQMSNWQQLDALLGLQPDVTFAIATPQLPALPMDLDAGISSLPQRRPDLIALQAGYRSADATFRAQILGQFPALVLGGSWSEDNTGIRSVGADATFDLPIFNRNQGQVSQARASRELLQQQYQAQLDQAVGGARALNVHAQRVAANLAEAEQAQTSAQQILEGARAAFAQGNMDQRSLADFESAALERGLDRAMLERSYGEDAITLAVDLGLGLPQTFEPPQQADLAPHSPVLLSASGKSEPVL